MKYTSEITIDLPRDRMLEIMDNPDNMQKWQEGLLRWEHMTDGDFRAPGAKMKMVFQQGKREMEIVETIVSHSFPEEFKCIYETKGVKNWANNVFHEAGPDKSRWVAEHEFQFSGFMKVMSFFMPTSMFKKQTLKTMNAFKDFAESQ